MNLKFFAGTTFVALLGILSVHPAIAQTRPNDNGVGNDQMQAPGRELNTPTTGNESQMNQTQMENQRLMNNQTPNSGEFNQTSPDGLTNQQRSLDSTTVEDVEIRRIQSTPIPARTNVQTQQQFQSQPTQPSRTDTQFNNSVDTTNDAAPVRGLW